MFRSWKFNDKKHYLFLENKEQKLQSIPYNIYKDEQLTDYLCDIRKNIDIFLIARRNDYLNNDIEYITSCLRNYGFKFADGEIKKINSKLPKYVTDIQPDL